MEVADGKMLSGDSSGDKQRMFTPRRTKLSYLDALVTSGVVANLTGIN